MPGEPCPTRLSRALWATSGATKPGAQVDPESRSKGPPAAQNDVPYIHSIPRMQGRSKETTGRSLLVAAARGALTFLPPTIMKTFHRATAASWRKSDTAVQEGITREGRLAVSFDSRRIRGTE